MRCCVTTIDHDCAMMQQSEALIDHLMNQVINPSRGVMHHSEAIIDHGCVMIHPSIGGIDHLIYQVIDPSDALLLLLHNNRSWLRHDASSMMHDNPALFSKISLIAIFFYF